MRRMMKMGKKNKGGNRPPKQSYLKQQEQKFGTGFLNRLNSKDIRENALRIFKDLADGAMNPDDVDQFFNQYDFTYNLIVAAKDNLDYRQFVYAGLISNPNIQYNEQMQRVASEVFDQINTYQILIAHLNNILYGITINGGYYTRVYLQQLIAEIRYRRNTFNGFFITLPHENDKQRIKKERRQIQHDKGFNNQNEGGFFNKPPQNNV